MDNFDDILHTTITLLHSPSPASASLMRHIVEKEIIKQKGDSETLKAKMSEIEFNKLKSLESQAVGSGFKPKRKIKRVVEQIEAEKKPTPRATHTNVVETEKIEPMELDQSSFASKMNRSIANALMVEYSCQICSQMESTTHDPLMECSACTLLFHASCDGVAPPKDKKNFVCNRCKPQAPTMRKDFMKVVKRVR